MKRIIGYILLFTPFIAVLTYIFYTVGIAIFFTGTIQELIGVTMVVCILIGVYLTE